MPRPFRSRPPVLSQPTLARSHLLNLVERRWQVRVVSVVAGPGFGKTTLLATAWAARDAEGMRQGWVSCEPADESEEHLLRGVTAALDLPPESDVSAVLDVIWADRPMPVCLVFDDLHEVPPSSPGASLLDLLVRELPENAHLVFSSRERSPVPLARLVAAGEVVTIEEDDLVFDADERAAFAASRGVESALLASTGGWPALAELTASAGGEWTLEYLREEVLARIGPERSRLLAAFALAGGGDDEVLAAVGGGGTTVDEVVRTVPLVTRSTDGWTVLHPLWEPALRRVLPPGTVAQAQRAAATVHRERGRSSLAMDLLVEAEDWEGACSVICESEHRAVLVSIQSTPAGQRLVPDDFGRWYRALPPDRRDEPAALLAAGIDLQSRAPMAAADRFRRAAEGFRAVGDVDVELAAISREGLIRSWRNDVDGLLALYARVSELAAAGSARAQTLGAIGLATVAHLSGDSRQVLALLDGVEEVGWMASIQWLRSVAHRRAGDLVEAHRALDTATDHAGLAEPQLDLARLRIRWLDGEVDQVAVGLRQHHRWIAASDHGFLVREAALEAAARAAWLGDVGGAKELLAVAPAVPDAPSVLADVLRAIALAAVAIEEGDEAEATRVLEPVALDGPAAVGRPESWYWHDRAALALLHVLVPETRPGLAAAELGGVHRTGRALAGAFETARRGDAPVAFDMGWPSEGVIRAHLPRRWVAELVEVAPASMPVRLVEATLPAGPAARVSIALTGPLTVRLDGRIVESGNLRRVRVRELLCYLVAHRRARREQIGEDLWPSASDPAHNLRVTLNYLLRALEPDRARNERPSLVTVEHGWLGLAADDRVQVDVWMLEQNLDLAARAERNGDVDAALGHYRTALPWWGGDPFVDVPHAAWAEPVRFHLRNRFVTAAVRAAELSMAVGDVAESRLAADRALRADSACEPAYRLLAQGHLEEGDASRARAVLARCRAALAELDVEPDEVTRELEALVTGSAGAR